MKLTAVDLFCGAGGLSLGLGAAGFDVLVGADAWGVAVDTYRLNFDHPVIEADLSSLSANEIWQKAGVVPQKVDLVVGGPPCQGFSIQRIGDDDDKRNHLVLEFGRLVREFLPKAFLMENVPGLIGKRGRALAEVFEKEMTQAGYGVEAVLANAAHFGVPQLRKRIFYYGWLRQDIDALAFAEPTHTEDDFRTVWDTIADLPSPPEDHTPTPGDRLHRRTRISPLNLERIKHVPPGGGMEDLPIELRVACHKNGAARIGHRFVYGRLAPDRPAGTITGRFDSFTRGKFAHPYEHRNITLREGARLQTFPDTFQFAGTQEEIAALIGNAVPPVLARAVGNSLSRHLYE